MSAADSTPHPTAVEVARQAGVSRTTVSLVLNGRGAARGITAATEQRVRDCAEALGYMPQMAARALRSGRSSLVLVVLPERPVPGTAGLTFITDLTSHLAPHGLDLITRRMRSDQPLTRMWQSLQPTAIIGIDLDPEESRQLAQAGLTIVDVAVDATNVAIGTMQAQHLVTSGHTAIGFAAPADPEQTGYADSRLSGIAEVCRQHGIAEPVVLGVPLEADGATAGVERLRRDHPGVTALCAYNDECAFAALAGAHRLGLRVPDQLAVIGADDIPLAAVAIPPLTTVSITGALAEDVTAEIIAGRDSPGRVWSRALTDLRVISRQTV